MLSGGPLSLPRHDTIQRALAAAAQSGSGLTFLDAQERERALPFAEMYLRARRAAGALRARGVQRGDRVAIVLPTGPEFMDAFFGALFAGAVPVPLYPPVRLARLDEYHQRTARMLESVGARIVLSDARISRLLGVAVSRARPELGLQAVDLGEEREEPAAPEELALIQFSSGTTADPKPVALTQRNILCNAAAIDSFVPRDDAQAGVSWLPLYHDMGLIGCLLLAVVHPGPLTLLGPETFLAKPSLWLRAISRKRATLSVAPNFAYGLCARRVRDDDLKGVDLSSWKFALNGAEPVAPAVLRRFAERFAPYGFDARAFMPVYGLSEASVAVTFTPPGRGPKTLWRDQRELASVGAPIPGVEVQIDPQSRIRVRGPSVMSGYFGNPAATSETLRDGWLDTGDLGFIEDGELYLSGREKDLVILRGANHAPEEFEEALDGLAGVRPGCAVAVGCVTEAGEELLLLVERSKSDPSLEETISARVVERTGIRPHRVHLLAPGTLPRTSGGKLRRAQALRLHLAGELRAPDKVTLLRLAREAARSLAARLRSGL
jgi:acyl-CoA synthetase (AMP-forming)/AMP-acid ligase II